MACSISLPRVGDHNVKITTFRAYPATCTPAFPPSTIPGSNHMAATFRRDNLYYVSGSPPTQSCTTRPFLSPVHMCCQVKVRSLGFSLQAGRASCRQGWV